MSEVFSFRFPGERGLKRENLAVFCSGEIGTDQIIKAIKDDCEKVFIPRVICLICYQSNISRVETLVSETSLISEVNDLLGEEDRVCILSADDCGNLIPVSSELKQLEFGKTSDVRKYGVIDIFQRRKGVITSSPTYHFVKPSGKHCDKFIRASNLLISSAEVMFLALPLMKFISPSIRKIYIDTSSIAYLVLTAMQMKGDDFSKNITIHSFESYSGINKDYDFVEAESSLVVISATTSSSLTDGLLDRTNFQSSQIVTLFHTGLPITHLGIFDISDALGAGITSEKPDECPFCKAGSKLIRIAGDQFLPETPKDDLVVIRKPDFSKKRERFFEKYATKSLLRWEVESLARDHQNEHFYFDVARELEGKNSELNKSLRKAFNKNVSQDMKHIVSVGGSGADALAKRIREFSEGKMEIHELDELDESTIKNFNSVLVVSGAITSGRRLLSASRKLRVLPDDAVICYLVAVSKLATDEASIQLEKDLVQGGHSLVILETSPMPRLKEYDKTSWDYERDIYQEETDPFSGDSVIPTLLKERASQLNSFGTDQLFLPAPNGLPLKLRDTFAFWTGLRDVKTSDASQADVYWTIQSVVHDLRIKSDEKGLASIYHSTLISPVCFDRYNDGVIQACILRTAKPVELNYTVDELFSRQMADVICSSVSSWENEQGEGALEFLVALVCDRLRINDEHLGEVVKLMTDEMPEIMRFFLIKLRDQLQG